MTRIGFAIDNRACIGCHACTVACKSEHEVPLGVNRTWVKYIEKGTFPQSRRSFSVQRCNHCEDAPCVEICPVTSLYQRPDGIVDFDADRCIGCKSCMQACPYDAIYLDPATNTAAKCNYCTHRVDNGFEPACVVVCPVEAIVSGDLDDPHGRLAMLDRTQRVQYPRVEKGTRPKLFYVGGETAAIDPTEAPPAADYLWSSADRGVTPLTLARAADEAEHEARARRVYDTQRKPAPWGWMVSAYVTTKALSAGIVIISFILFLFGDTPSALPAMPAVLSALFLAITGVFLVADLKQPRRFLYVLLRPQWRSWLVRGAYLITAFGLMLVICFGLAAARAGSAWQTVAGAVTAGLAAAVAVYTAFLFAQAKGRDYWQNPLLSLTMLWDALVTGTAVLAVLGELGVTGGIACDAGRWGLLACVGSLGVLTAGEHLSRHPTRHASLAARSIVRGRYRGWFWGGVVGIGLVLPLVVLVFGGSVSAAGLAIIAGIAVKNHILVQAPQLVPLS